MKLHKAINDLKKISAGFIFIIITLLIFIYLPCNIYNFQPPQKFSGNFLYNPYRNLSGNWKKVNFHAHSVAWHGITNGIQSEKEIISAYKLKGYDYASISNYERVAKADDHAYSIKVYEHGCNISKTHQLVIMPQRICYEDFPLFQSASTKQFVISKLSTQARAVVLAHPRVRKGYKDEELQKLSGYNLMEVLNHAGSSASKWDVALSAGKPVWIIGDDDTHDILNLKKTFTNWTMINCSQNNKDSLVDNLINGNAYAVNGKNAFNDNGLLEVKTQGTIVMMQLQKKADSIQLVGQNGTVKKLFLNTDKILYKFLKSDTYLRAVVYNKASIMYLNPVIRFNGKKSPQNLLTAAINIPFTILYRASLIIGWISLFLIFNYSSIKRAIILKRYKTEKGYKHSLEFY